MGAGHSGNSPLRNNKNALMQNSNRGEEDASGIDFSQYHHMSTMGKDTSAKKGSPKKGGGYQPTARNRGAVLNGGLEGDVYLNEKLKYLEV